MSYQNIPIIVVLWQHENYGGRRVILTEDTADLGVYNFHDSASAIGIHPGPDYNSSQNYQVSFYQHSNYRGGQLVLTPGAYPTLKKPYNFENTISSVNLFRGIPSAPSIRPIRVVAELYEHANYRGKRLNILENVSNIHSYSDFGDIVSSVKVFEGPDYTSGSKARLCRDTSGRGGCIELEVGEYPNLSASHGFNDVVSSIYVR